MPVATIKFSQFVQGGGIETGDQVAGLRDGINTLMDGDTINPYVPLPYIVVTSLHLQMDSNNGYITNNAGNITLVLPVSFAVGDVFEIVGFGAGGWSIEQNAGQQIFVGKLPSTAGIAGGISSTQAMDSIKLVGVVASTSLLCVGGPQGNITVF
jgi:hypothetical protein